jgi:hypothetical protein
LHPEQWADFASVALNTQAIRHAYEASIAQVSSLEQGRYRLEIPAYPEVGDALRARFYADLHGKLGGPTADRIYAEMGHSLEAYFSGFGTGGQTLEIAADRGGAEMDYAVTRTATFRHRGDSGERWRTRRETHFPGIEDPTGHAWGPYLSVLAAHAAAKSGS